MSYSTKIVSSLNEVSESSWNALLNSDHPFIQYCFLQGLEKHQCLRSELGWSAHHLTLWDGADCVAAAPCYQKTNSHGEFVFDHAWAHAHEQLGIEYYPKLLCAIPYSPITGQRLLCAKATETAKQSCATTLLQTMQRVCERAQYSSVHVNFADDFAAKSAHSLDWLPRNDIQFHWKNAPYPAWADFLNTLNAKRRKEIRRERDQVIRAGWRFERRHGHNLSPVEIEEIYRLYADTFIQKGNYPALSLAFFQHLTQTMPDQIMVVVGYQGGSCLIDAMAFFFIGDNTLYGRYWGTRQFTPGLHFEACYYQGIEYCIERNLAKFEPGAQGEHKIARGFMPVLTRSFHWIANPQLRAAIALSLKKEAVWLSQYQSSVLAHSPYAQKPHEP
jgi:predicted N-acyltransferase